MKLKGVGPATASALMNDGCFMSDEALIGLGLDRTYTLKQYKNFAKTLRRKAKELGVTCAELEMAFWTLYNK